MAEPRREHLCMTDPTMSDRRTFLRRGAMGAGALWMFSLQELTSRRAYGAPLTPSPYGPPSPKIDGTTGLALLQLPDGFEVPGRTAGPAIHSRAAPCAPICTTGWPSSRAMSPRVASSL